MTGLAQPQDQRLSTYGHPALVRLSTDEFNRLIGEEVTPGDSLYEKAYASHLITREGQSDCPAANSSDETTQPHGVPARVNTAAPLCGHVAL